MVLVRRDSQVATPVIWSLGIGADASLPVLSHPHANRRPPTPFVTWKRAFILLIKKTKTSKHRFRWLFGGFYSIAVFFLWHRI